MNDQLQWNAKVRGLASLRRGIGLLSMAVVAASTSCGSSHSVAESGEPAASARSALAAAPVDASSAEPAVGEAAGPTAVAVTWTQPAGGTTASEFLTAELINNTAELQRGKLLLVASGLDGQLVQRPMEAFVLQPNAHKAVNIPVRSLPIQSHVAMSFAALMTEQQGADGTVTHMSSGPLDYIFDPDYKSVQLYTPKEAALEPHGGLRTSNGMNVQGRLVDSNGVAHAVAAPDPQALRQGLTGSGRISPDELAALRAKAGSVGAAAGTGTAPAAGDPLVEVCSNWRVLYVDSYKGEDVWASNTFNDRPASYAGAMVLSYDFSNVEWSGFLDANGCTPLIPLFSGDYLLLQWTENNTAGVDFQSTVSGSWGYEYAYFHVPSSSAHPYAFTLKPPANNDAMQTSAIAGKMLRRQFYENEGNGLGLKSGERFIIQANTGCNGLADESCSKGSHSYIGPESGGNGTPGSYWKYLVAHEIGHLIEEWGRGAYDFPGYYRAEDNALCRCDKAPAHQQSHCLQSHEFMGAAEREGFAHFIATKLWNNWGEANAVFVYYKPFLSPTGTVYYPPFGANGFSPVRWLQGHCTAPLAGDGNEWDWSTFYYNVDSAAYPNRTSVFDLFSIWHIACTGDPEKSCTPLNDTPSWVKFRNAAGTWFNYGPQYVRFVNALYSFGVNN